MEERLQDIDRRREKEVASDMTQVRVESGVVNTPTTKRGQAAAMEWLTVEKRTKKENRPVKITTGSGSKSPRKAPDRRPKAAERARDKTPLPRTPRTSTMTNTLKEGWIQS
jgi:hypothetical protein